MCWLFNLVQASNLFVHHNVVRLVATWKKCTPCLSWHVARRLNWGRGNSWLLEDQTWATPKLGHWKNRFGRFCAIRTSRLIQKFSFWATTFCKNYPWTFKQPTCDWGPWESLAPQNGQERWHKPRKSKFSGTGAPQIGLRKLCRVLEASWKVSL